VDEVLESDIALLDGAKLDEEILRKAVARAGNGGTAYLHALSAQQVELVLEELSLDAGEIRVVSYPQDGTFCTVRHTDELTDGISNNNLYWTVGSAETALWTRTPVDPEAATCVIEAGSGNGIRPLTDPCAAFRVDLGEGTLVVDNMQWQRASLEEPQRARRYLSRLLTNLGVALGAAGERTYSADEESAEERRERGKF
jgi:hypothetical protein